MVRLNHHYSYCSGHCLQFQNKIYMAKAVLSFGEHEHTSRLAKYVEEESKHNRPVHLGDGNKIRDYMRVDKAAKEIVQLLTQKQTGPTNICSGVGISIREFASNIARSYKNEHNLYFDSTAKRAGDPERVVGVKGF